VPAGEGVTIETVNASDRTRPVSRVEFAEDAGEPLFAATDRMTARLADAALVLVAADALGGAQKVTDMSVAYAKEREQFGQPIGRFQALKHQLAHMALDVEPGAHSSGTRPMRGTRGFPMHRAQLRWQRRICAMSMSARHAPRSQRMAASAIRGNMVSTIGFAAPCSIVPGLAARRSIARGRPHWLAGKR
jgi:alkylation response protein AidB-like acyl-CoA dehydrogenase